jgi:hypothetical protein
MDQFDLVCCYNNFLKIKDFIVYKDINMMAYLSGIQSLSEKPKSQFQFIGKYFSNVKSIKPDNLEGVSIMGTSQKGLLVDIPMYEGCHHHFLVLHEYFLKITYVDSHLYFENQMIDEQTLNILNIIVTNKFKFLGYTYIYERYRDTHSLVII